MNKLNVQKYKIMFNKISWKTSKKLKKLTIN